MSFFDRLSGLMAERFGSCERADRRMFFRQKALIFRDGVHVYFDPDPSGRAVVEVPQSALDAMAPADRLALVRALSLIGFRSTRVDVFYDDPDFLVRPAVVKMAADSFAVPRCRYFQYHSSGAPGEAKGETTVIGRRGKDGGGRVVRCYDKEVESGGKNKSIRWEVELSGARAVQAFELMANPSIVPDLDKWAELLGALLGGSVDFFRRDDRRVDHLDRLERYPWWETIRERLGHVPLSPRVVGSTVESAMEAHEKQWAATLANIDEYLRSREVNPLAGAEFEWVDKHGEIVAVSLELVQWVAETVKYGRHKLSRRHEVAREAAVANYRASVIDAHMLMRE